MELPDDRVIEYGHDRYGRRVSKSIDGRLVETYAWQGLVQLTGYEDGTGAMAFHYGQGRPPLALTRNGQRFSLHFDQVGTLRAVAHDSGRLIQTSAYDSFGNPLEVLHPQVRIPLGFAGGLLDSDTGLTRFGFRNYDPDTGRFTAKDPQGHLGGDPDLYGYCLDDPVNQVDPAGLMSEEERQGIMTDVARRLQGFEAIAHWPLDVSAPFEAIYNMNKSQKELERLEREESGPMREAIRKEREREGIGGGYGHVWEEFGNALKSADQ